MEAPKEPENPNVQPEAPKVRSNISFLQSLERPRAPPPHAKRPPLPTKEKPCTPKKT